MSCLCTAKYFKKVTHVIFDMDGLLLDTETLDAQTIQLILDEYGKTYTWEINCQMLGLTGKEAAYKIVEIYPLPISGEEFSKRYKEINAEMMQKTTLMPGVEKLIKHLYDNKIPCAVATSSRQQSFCVKSQCHKELFSHFHHIVTGGSDPEVKHGKPAPDIFMLAADRFPDKPKYEDCLVFEDAPNGVLAAIAAGMQVVMIPDKRIDADLCKNATLVLKSMEEFQPELFGLPPFPNKCIC